ncbi:MAG: serine/threonine protein kinase [Candidatus Riflebacteria bacterium]|nr:serine/threonine protein kinase [Candidatus Riflebacteria bacterium]
MTQVPSPPGGRHDPCPFPADCARKFAPIRPIASGGYGAVFLAEQIDLGRQVAVKLLLVDLLEEPEQVQRFNQEARITASLSHPNIIQIIDHGAQHGIPWIAYELISGQSLRDLIDTGTLTFDRSVEAAIQVADALEAAHSSGVLHRDIKPDNVLEAEPGRYKVMDFGIAKWTQGGAVRTRAGMILGTPAYVSPEQVTGDAASASSDVYALGVMLFELVTGQLPFQAENPVLLLECHIKARVPSARKPRPELPASIDRVIARALAKSTRDRYPSARAMRDDLDLILRARTASAVRERGPGVRRAPPTVQLTAVSARQRAGAGGDTAACAGPARGRLYRGAVLGLVVALGAVAALLSSRHDGAPEPAASAGRRTPAGPEASEDPAAVASAGRFHAVHAEACALLARGDETGALQRGRLCLELALPSGAGSPGLRLSLPLLELLAKHCQGKADPDRHPPGSASPAAHD